MLYNRVIKRLIDLFAAIGFVLIFWWLFLLICLIILVTDGRPVLFKQKRIGQYGKVFYIYKFRTMVKNAEEIGPSSTYIDDHRITPIGAFLRKTSLDEIPQVINLLCGNMSLVGYRPGVLDNYTKEDLCSEIFSVRPGITGYAQINGRSSLSIEEKRRWEKKYAEEISFSTDLKILIKTVIVVLFKSNAY